MARLASAAGRAARARAIECHARLEELRDATRATTQEDVARAHEALLRAAFRAAMAEERSTAALQGATTAPIPDGIRPGAFHGESDESSPSMREPDAPMHDLQLERMATLGIAVDDLWIQYAALCGSCSRLELEAYLNGALELSSTERVRIDQALWELGSRS